MYDIRSCMDKKISPTRVKNEEVYYFSSEHISDNYTVPNDFGRKTVVRGEKKNRPLYHDNI